MPFLGKIHDRLLVLTWFRWILGELEGDEGARSRLQLFFFHKKKICTAVEKAIMNAHLSLVFLSFIDPAQQIFKIQ